MAQNLKIRKTRAPYRVLGRTSDGVEVLEPVGKPSHFTVGQIRLAVAQNKKRRKPARRGIKTAGEPKAGLVE